MELSKFLVNKGVEIISTGGTYRYLSQKGIPVKEVSEITGFEEMLDGRVKTLHPVIEGGILAIRENKEHMNSLLKNNIVPIDIVVVNLYPFFDKVQEDLSFEEKLEFIDIGGPTMIRAAAKNFKDVIVVTDIEEYEDIMENLSSKEDLDYNYRKKLAGKAFNLTCAYDAAVCSFLLEEEYPEYLPLSYKRQQQLRYGENSHQSAAFYVSAATNGAVKDFIQLGGKELSYNNIKDIDAAWKIVNEFEETVCCAVKHNSPCGVALGNNSLEAYAKTYECDPVSIFGGIVAFNKIVDLETSKELVKVFLEVVMAPDFTADALETLKQKKNLRIIKCSTKPKDKFELVSVDGGLLVQERDTVLTGNLSFVTEKKPSENELKDLNFGMKVVKYVKSNAIVVVKDGMAKGIGGGQVNRIWPAIQALDRAKDGVVLASDGFFPFKDVVEEAVNNDIRAIIQPGGSVNDKESIDCCNENGIAMIFTGMRHFKH